MKPAEAFLAQGHRVFAASRSLVKMETLSPAIVRTELDVNDEASIAQGVAEIIQQAGKIG
jgi:NADP-dependent 3-hydroxy acid dehydrogenase YdfG